MSLIRRESHTDGGRRVAVGVGEAAGTVLYRNHPGISHTLGDPDIVCEARADRFLNSSADPRSCARQKAGVLPSLAGGRALQTRTYLA